MTDSTETKQSRPLTLAAPRMEVKPMVETGLVRQKFSHGRTKSVTVEVKKKRTLPPTGTVAPAAPPRVVAPAPRLAEPTGVPAVRLAARAAVVAAAAAAAPASARAPEPARPVEPAVAPAVSAPEPATQPPAAIDAPVAPAPVAVVAPVASVVATPAPVEPPPAPAIVASVAVPEPVVAPSPVAAAVVPRPVAAPVAPRPVAAATASRGPVSTTGATSRIVRPGAAAAPGRPAPSAPAGRPATGSNRPGAGRGVVLRTLTAEEREVRARALVGAAKDDVVRRERAAEEARRRTAEEERAKRAREDAERRAVEEEARKKADEEGRRKAEEQAQKRLKEAQAKAGTSAAAARNAQMLEAEIDGRGGGTTRTGAPMSRPAGVAARPGASAPGAGLRRPAVQGAGRKPHAPGGRREAPKRRTDKVDVGAALAGDDLVRGRSVAQLRRANEKEKRKLMSSASTQKVYREVIIPETITVQELGSRMSERGADVIRVLMKMGQLVTINQVLDADTAELVVTEMGHTPRRVSDADVEVGLGTIIDPDELLMARPPVVTIMGHVDHGKTSVLDALRATDVAGHEAGGITQHIGAYQVQLASGQRITFLDTPGHEAFTAMRSRGAKVTDIVVLVVAADDGIMPQTIEAITHAKAAKVPMIVAINKVDKPDADAKRVRQALLQYEVQVEEFGGEVQSVEVSALKKTNLDKLEEAILLQAEVLDLKANAQRPAEGTVIEAQLDPGRGSIATVLVQRGTLKVGDVFVAGAIWGRVRRLLDDRGKAVTEAGPAYPVEVLGLTGTPEAGDEFHVVDTEARAREIAGFRAGRDRQAQLARDAGGRGSLEDMLKGIREGTAKELPVVIKGDVQGSVEALIASMKKLATDKVQVRVLHSGVGGVNESDVTLARASGALIVAFNVRANPQARKVARRDKVEIRYYSIIYNVIDDVKALMTGLLDAVYKENFLGYADIRQVFNITKVGNVGGCMVTEGTMKRGSKVRLLRDDTVIHEGTLKTLKRFKDEVREVNSGFECGMAFENYEDIRVGDRIECFDVEQMRPTL